MFELLLLIALTAACLLEVQGEEGAHAQNRSPANRAAGGRGGQQTGAVANADADIGDDEGVTLAEFNRWLVQEDNWQLAEETRESYMEGSQFRKTRDERHRERGMERQAASIEQMKVAKGRVEEHRQQNLEHGKVHTWIYYLNLPDPKYVLNC